MLMDTPDHRTTPAQILRRKSEEKLRTLKSLDTEGLGPEETRQLIHDLRVHQIELEIQNEELRKVQGDLDLSLARYFELYDFAPVGYISLSEKGVILEANLAAAVMLGMNRGELAGQALTRFVFNEDQDTCYHYLKTLFGAGESQACRIRMHGPSSDTVLVQLEATAVREADGAMMSRVAMIDITERCKAETLLQEKETFLSSVLRAAPIGIGVVVDRELVQVNLQICEMTGYSQEELVGRNARILYLSDKDYETVGREKYAQIREKGTGSVETRWKRKNGEAIDVLLSSTPLALEDLLKGVVFTAMDITERRRAETALREREALLRIAGRTSKFGGWSANLSDQKVIWSDEVAVIHEKEPGYSPSVDEGIQFYAPEYRATVSRIFRDCALEGKPYDEEMEIITARGHRRWVRTTGEAVRDESGEIIRVHGAFQDITRRKRSEAKIRQLRKAEGLGRMAGAIAHHYNNLLAAVMGNLELAEADISMDSSAAVKLSEAMKAARRASEIGGLMLAYLGQTVARREPLDLSEICRGHLADLQASMPDHVILETDLPLPGPVVSANADQLRQALNALVINAREAVGERTGKVSLKFQNVSQTDIPAAPDQISRVLGGLIDHAKDLIKSRREVISLNVRTVAAEDISGINRFPVEFQPGAASYACLEVRDKGCGIAEAEIEKLFDPFYSTKFTGRGLGLPVALGAVKAHGGCITVETGPGRGSVFRVYLPLTGEKISRSKLQWPDGTVNLKGVTALIVEDDEAMRLMAATMLGLLDMKVLEAGDGVEAVEVFKNHVNEIRCVLCDLTMPQMDGWETIEALRRLSPGIPVILVSGYDAATAMDGDHPELPQAFLSKPYGMRALKESLAKALEGK
ncbi:MAG: PAS domain S-box protein [Desulfobacteraceae bacterium]|nr:MAG: PAS domain S-box protein [Desulfobacteraceae bacterium]